MTIMKYTYKAHLEQEKFMGALALEIIASKLSP